MKRNKDLAWKNGAPFALCLTHDVDRIKKQWYHYLYYMRRGIHAQVRSFRERLSGRDPYFNFYRLMELEQEAGVRSTFFFLHETKRKLHPNFMGRYLLWQKEVRAVIRELDAAGFEIGLHGSYYSYDDLRLMESEKHVLEDIVGHAVVSARQHHLNFKPGITWGIQSRIGIKYDSTIGFSHKTGECLSPVPYRTKEGIWEFPITVMDTIPLVNEHDARMVQHACGQVAGRAGVVVLDFHQCRFNPIERPLVVQTYRNIIEKAKASGAWLVTMRELGKWMEERAGE